MDMSNEPEIILECPHCKEFVIIEKLNCHIFRHGSMKNDGKQIDPHSPKSVCDYLFERGLIYGCGKPFRAINLPDNNKYIAVICDYI